MKRHTLKAQSRLISHYVFATCLAVALTACGGGGGSSGSASSGSGSGSGSSSGTGSRGSTSKTQAITLTSLQVKTTDILATTAPSQKLGVLMLDHLQRFFKRSSDMLMSTAYADNSCGQLCQPNYPPANIPAQQQLTAKLGSGGVLSTLSPVFSTANPSQVQCDFTNVGVLVNSIWLLDTSSQNALVNLSVPTSVDSSCNLTYTAGDYVVIGSTGQVVALNQTITSDVSDMLPAGDVGINQGTNAIYLSKADGLIRELTIDPASGGVSLTVLTTASQPISTLQGAFNHNLAYDGTYLVGNAQSFSGLVIYKKGTSAFQILRNSSMNFLDDQGVFVVTNTGSAVSNDFEALNPSAAALGPWTPSSGPAYSAGTDHPYSIGGGYGRFGTVVAGNVCNLWDYAKKSDMDIASYPTVYSSSLPASASVGASLDRLPTVSYSRLSGQYLYCVDANAAQYTRWDVTAGQSVSINTDSLGYVIDTAQFMHNAFTVASDRAYAKVTNTANSNVEYIEISFTTGQATYLGTISAGGRDVVNLVKASNG